MKKGPSAKMVWIIKQWHQSPSVNTNTITEKIPQEKNQTAIFKQLDHQISKGQLSEVIAEGCSGELNENSSIQINGWNVRDLKSELKRSTYSEIVTR